MNINGAGGQILFAGYRFFLAGVMTLIIGSVIEKKPLLPKKASVLPILGQGILQTAVQYLFFYLGLARTTGAKGSVINASGTFFSILFACLMIKNERLDLKKTAGCVIGFAGVIAVNITDGGFDGGFSFAGEGFVLISSVAYGLSCVTLKRISNMESAVTITGFQLLFGGAILTAAGLISGAHITGFTLKSAMLLLYLAALSAVAFTVWTALLKYNPVGKTAVWGFSIPVFGVALSGLILKENIFTLNNLFALLLVSAGIILVNINGKKSYKKNDD